MSTRTARHPGHQPPATRRPSRTNRTSPGRRKGTGVRVAWWAAVGVIAVLLVAIAAVASRSGADDAAGGGAGAGVAPANTAASGWVGLGDGPVTVGIYFDYLCPACGAFEEANGADLDRMLKAGEISVELRPMSFLDRLSAGTAYSTRAANALATVVDADLDSAWEFHRALYRHQPAEGEPGLTDEEIAAIAVQAGASSAVADRLTEGRFEDWVASRTEQAFAEGVEGTPTITIDGEVFTGDPYATGSVAAAVARAAR
jgi:protein-disulfide isomerase